LEQNTEDFYFLNLDFTPLTMSHASQEQRNGLYRSQKKMVYIQYEVISATALDEIS